MKFKYSVIGDNTQENREYLIQIGYYQLASDWMLENIDKLIITNRYCKYFDTIDKCAALQSDAIDCRSNPPLFQAVTAIREDSDYMQWFVITRYNEAKEEIVDEWRLCKTDIFDVNSMPFYGIIASEKATLEELTEKFKSEKK